MILFLTSFQKKTFFTKTNMQFFDVRRLMETPNFGRVIYHTANKCIKDRYECLEEVMKNVDSVDLKSYDFSKDPDLKYQFV